VQTESIWHFPQGASRWIDSWRLLCSLAVIFFLLMQITGGVVRWVLDMVGAAALAYLPNVAMLGCVGLMVAYDIAYNRVTRGAMLMVVLVLLSSAVGMVTTGNLTQVVFGVWVLTPFFFGLVCAPVMLTPGKYQVPFLVLMFLATSGGVIVHDSVAYPWVGVSYQIGGVELEGAREWHTGEKQRLSGLARSSFDVAGQILVAAALLSLQIKKGYLRTLMWGACIFGISLSTSKGILLALAMTVMASECLIRRITPGLRWIFFAGMLWLFVPPLMGWTMDWSEQARTDIDNPLYGSFIDRMNDMWPKAMDLATVHGLPPLGRGVGGIGVPLSLFDPALFNAGDNVFVYCWVIVGIFAVPIFAAGFLALFRMCKDIQSEKIRTTLILAVAVNWYGGVSNILEHALLACAMGIVCRVCAAYLADERLLRSAPSSDIQHPPPPQ
jgi:hypothetical protein